MQFAELPLYQLSAHPDNPRKTFDQIGLQELADSIREKGVLQPILVRPLGDAYQVVCGERRFRASQLAGLETIPVTIRGLNEEEALEAMLLENFQRQDVHPIEEAMGFAALRRMNNMTPIQIASKVGKSHQYVTSRLKLASLIPELHEPFYSGKISLKLALELAGFASEVQMEWLNEQDVDDEQWGNHKGEAGLSQNELNTAAFDTTDEKLIPNVGACGGCQYNTATSQLFPELEASPRCMNPVCFELKTIAKTAVAIKQAIENETPILIEYNVPAGIKKMLQGVKHLEKWRAHHVSAPERDSIFHNGEDPEDPWFDSREEYDEYIAECEQEWKEAVEEWENAQNSEDYTAGLLINNNGSSSTVYLPKDGAKPITTFGSSSSKVNVKDVQERVKSGEATLVERSQAVDQLNAEKEAAREITAEKIFKDAKTLFEDREMVKIATGQENQTEDNPNPIFFEDAEMSDIEIKAAIWAMLSWLSGERAGIFVQVFCGHSAFEYDEWCDENKYYSYQTQTAYLYAMESLQDKNGRIPLKVYDKFQRAWMRYYIDNRIAFSNHSRSENTGFAASLYLEFAKYHFDEQMTEIEAKHKAALNTKLKNIDTKISLIDAGL